MKTVDRYIVSTFLKNYVISFAVLVGLYVVLDMIFNFDDLVDIRSANPSGLETAYNAFRNIFDYYSYQITLIFANLSGIIPVVAAAFTLIRLTRFNELTALMAAGVPLLRIAAPIIFTSVLLTGLLIVDEEVIIPAALPKLIRTHDEVGKPTAQTYSIPFMLDSNGATLTAGRYTPPGADSAAVIEVFDLVERNGDWQPSAHVWAKRAQWDATHGTWNLTDGYRVTGLLPTQRLSATQPLQTYKSNITPDEIALYHSSDYVQMLPTSRLNELLDPKRSESYGRTELQRVKHTRFTQWITNLFLLLLAIPFVLTREPGQMKQGAIKCVVVVGSAMGMIFLFYRLAGSAPPRPEWAEVWPALMAWMPVFLLGPTSILLLDRVKS